MKIPKKCVICKQGLVKERLFPDISHDTTYIMRCGGPCLPKLILWETGDFSNSYATEVQYSSKDCKEEEAIFMSIDINSLSLEFHLRGKFLTIFHIDYEPTYNAKHLVTLDYLPDISLEDMDVNVLKNKAETWVLFA